MGVAPRAFRTLKSCQYFFTVSHCRVYFFYTALWELIAGWVMRAQVYILDAIAMMHITEAKDAESIVERVVPRLQHANSAVVLSAVKVSSHLRHTRERR